MKALEIGDRTASLAVSGCRHFAVLATLPPSPILRAGR